MKKVIIFTWCFVIYYFLLQAQNNQHSTLWLKQTIGHKFDEKNRVELELLHRRQSFFEQNIRNPFSQKWINASRLNYFRQVNKSMMLIFSPMSVWQNKGLINQHSDLNKIPQRELRLTLGEETKLPLTSKSDFLQRNLFELRWQKTVGAVDFAYINRFRTRYLVKYNFDKQFSVTLGDEFFIHFGKNSGFQNFFDQNRVIFNAAYQVSEHWKLELGYILIHQKRKNIEVFDKIDTYNLNSIVFF